ncbi:MAG TPA: hypothetical protein VMW89_18475 [Desulfatiglandales bacterium]|nr:hypothetical protein [Desulfatiglandales bacterium]
MGKTALLTGAHLKDASVGFDRYGHAMVHLEFDSRGAKTFGEVTSRYVGRRLAIILDGKLHSAPVINEPILSGKAQITGNFTSEEAHDLALVLRAGSLPAPVKVVEERTVGPSLGKDSVEKGVRAALLGALLVFAFMPGYYLMAGLIADVGLIVYTIVVIGALAVLWSALTLPGIAGFILSVSRVDRFLPILQVEVCFLRLPPGFPAVPPFFNHTPVGPSRSQNRTGGFPR